MTTKSRTAVASLALIAVAAIVFLFVTAHYKNKDSGAQKEIHVFSDAEIDHQTQIIGDFAYIRLNIEGEDNDHVLEILNAISSFERNNPRIKVVSWDINSRHPSYEIGGYIYGIWIKRLRRIP